MKIHRTVLLTLISFFLSLAAYAQPVASDPATYILHVSSNLSCKIRSIELISKADKTSQYLTMKTASIATADLPAGEYMFGDIVCRGENGLETLNGLKGKIAPLTLRAGQAYYGGTMLFEQKIEVDLEAGRKEIDECPFVNSGARGPKSYVCQSGIGMNKSTRASKQISIFAPPVSEETLAAVRKALSVSENQLLYLPIKG